MISEGTSRTSVSYLARIHHNYDAVHLYVAYSTALRPSSPTGTKSETQFRAQNGEPRPVPIALMRRTLTRSSAEIIDDEDYAVCTVHMSRGRSISR